MRGAGRRAQAAGPWPAVRGAAGRRRPEAARRRHGAWRSRSAAAGRPTAAVAVRRRAPPRARGTAPAPRGGKGGGDHHHHQPPLQVISSHAHGPSLPQGRGALRAARMGADRPGTAAAARMFAAAPAQHRPLRRARAGVHLAPTPVVLM